VSCILLLKSNTDCALWYKRLLSQMLKAPDSSAPWGPGVIRAGQIRRLAGIAVRAAPARIGARRDCGGPHRTAQEYRHAL
jgi:hypothetical protein